MAFVYRAPRTTNSEPSDIGPGTYLGQDTLKVSRAHAPFSSTEKRDFTVGPMTAPGPGSYSASNLMLKPPLYREPIFGQGGLVRPTGPYVTNEERFRDKKEEGLAGPGSYQVAPKWPKPKQMQPPPSSKKLIRAPSAPSIPSLMQAFGYDQTPHGELQPQANPEKVFKGTPTDCVGPGHYNARSPDEIWRSKGTAWHKSKTLRAAISAPATGEKVGPGAYNDIDANLTPMEKFRPSAAFANRVKRTSYIPPLGKEVDEDDSWDDSGDDAVPGPGYYYQEQLGSSFRKSGTRTTTARNTSSAPRFEREKKDTAKIGPGTYGDLRMPVLPKRFSYGKVPFNSNDARFHPVDHASPGPGSYHDIQGLSRARDWGRERGFGTTEKRFSSTGDLDTPGPGYYPPDAHKRVGIHNSATRKPLSVFVSKVKRAATTIKEVPAVGEYEYPSDFGPPKPPPRSTHPRSLMNAGVKVDLAFSTMSKRFVPAATQLPDKVGPGTYDPKIVRDIQHISKTLPPKPDKAPPRFPPRPGLITPGPGAYYVEKPTEWTKQTFNMTFVDHPRDL